MRGAFSGIALLMWVAAASTPAAELFEKLSQLKAQVAENEPRQLWKQVRWQSDIETAQKAAHAQNKPILVFMLVNENGKPDAEHC